MGPRAQRFKLTMNFAIKVCQSGGCPRVPNMALEFIRALNDHDHRVLRVFFYHEAVALGFGDSAGAWADAAQQGGFELVLCSQAVDQRMPGQSPHAAFTVGGLALWVDASLRADRCLTFGVPRDEA
jgi:tRNA 2-thiouridine synthesizing protein D